MGKYSLESYERYQMVKCRPLEKAEAEGTSVFETVRVVLGGERPVLGKRTLLEVFVPGESITSLPTSMPETESSLRSLAARYYRDPQVIGVTLIMDANTANKRRLYETAAEAFAPKRYYVPVEDGEQLDYALKHGFVGGLVATVGENIYDTCEAFAKNNAQQLFKQMPVLVRFLKGNARAADYAAAWHAEAVEGAKTLAGWRIALRRLVYPKTVSSGGYAPMRFWWTNRGPSFCHEETEVRLRLEKEGRYTSIALKDHPSKIHLADRVYNEIVKLPKVESGVYRLEYGLFLKTGEPLSLAHGGETADGYYYADVMTFDDTPRPEFETLWDDFFEDGYYPLEDPKQPV